MDTTCPLVLLFLLLFIISFSIRLDRIQLKLKITFSTKLIVYHIFFIFFKIIYYRLKQLIRIQGMLKVGRRVSLDTDTPIGQAHRHPHVSRSLIKLNAIVVF